MLVNTKQELEEICEQLRQAGSFGLDTEFVQERSYFIQLGVIQVGAGEIFAVIDPQAVRELDALEDLIADPEIETVVHAGRIDFEVFFQRSGRVPHHVFDTQIAAAFVGFGSQISYSNLVRKLANVKLPKHHTLTDWTRRPLSQDQIQYALEDVRYLGTLRRKLGEQLAARGREQWVREECSLLESPDLYQKFPPREIYRKLMRENLGRQELSVLRELAAWREETAMKRDVPRTTIMRDEMLIKLAHQAPTSRKTMQNIRFLRPKALERYADDILDAVERGLKGPYPELPERKKRRESPINVDAASRLLEAWLRQRALDANIASQILATRSEMDALATCRLNGSDPDLRILTGWRREFVGLDLLKILDGKIHLGVDTTTGAVVSKPSPGS